jgi:Ca-activated chloride channel family protein
MVPLVGRICSSVCAVWALVVVMPAAQEVKFKTRTDIVRVHASVTAADGSVLTDLRRDEFELWDAGKRKEILQFAIDTRPINVNILLDNSPSTYASGSWRMAAIEGFLNGLRGDDRASLRTLTRLVQSPTNDVDLLRAAIQGAVQKDQYSPIWQACELAIQQLETVTGYRAVLVFTDGLDTSSAGPPESLLRLVERSDVVLYLAMLDNPMPTNSNSVEGDYQLRVERAQAKLMDLVKSSGGRTISVRGTQHVREVFMGITDELRHRYLLGFQAEALDGKYHQLRLRVTRPRVTVNGRTGYMATKPS